MAKMTLGEAIDKLRDVAAAQAKPALRSYLDDLKKTSSRTIVTPRLVDEELTTLRKIKVILEGIKSCAQILGVEEHELLYK